MDNLIVKAKKSKNDMEELIEKFMPLIKNAAKKHSRNREEDYYECLNEGVIGFINCVNKYPLDSKIHFAQYSLKAVNSHIYNFINKLEKKKKNTVSLNSPTDSKEELTIEETISDNKNLENDFLQSELIDKVKAYVENLNEIERIVFEKHFLKGYTLKEIQEYTGYSYRGIKYAKERIVSKIKNDILTEY